MKAIIMQAQLLDGTAFDFDFYKIRLFLHSQTSEAITYIKYEGANYALKTESIHFVVSE